MTAKTQLEKLVGKDFIYKQTNIRIRDYYPVPEEKVMKIITDGSTITIPETGVKSFCEDLLLVDSPQAMVLSSGVTKEVNSMMATLQQTLLDNIEMVKKDKNYIPQAASINKSVNSLLGITKVQLEVAKMKSKM